MTFGRQDLERAYRAHGPVVLRRARQIMGNEAEAREVLQEVFTSLLERPEQFDGRAAASTFLYAMTTNLCLNKLRNSRTRARLVAEHVEPGIGRVAPGDAEARAILRQLLVQLPFEEARVAVFYYQDGMTRPEIAEILGCSLRTVGTLLERLAAHVREPSSTAESNR